MPPNEDSLSSLERARERLYQQAAAQGTPAEFPLSPAKTRSVPRAWKETILPSTLTGPKRHIRLATLFLGLSVAFFIIALVVAGFFFYLGGNSVSNSKIDIRIQGPSNISGGDTVPLSLIIVNKNPVALEEATIAIDFPPGTRSADDVLEPYLRYTEALGSVPSGATITRSISAVVFGGAGDSLELPISLTYKSPGSNSVFAKKLTYALTITSTPLSVSVDTVAEAVSGQPVTLTLNVRSNATVALDNVIVSSILPFGFTVTNSSVPLADGAFRLGTLEPGESKAITLTGTLEGQQNEQRVFRFTVGTSRSESDPQLGVTYMTQEASVLLTAPFISTALSVNGNTSANVTVNPGTQTSVTVSYTNTLSTTVTNATVSVKISGNGIDYDTIETSNGFYDSSTRSVVFSSDTDASFASLAPGASGVGSFTFETLPANRLGTGPTITFSTSVSGTRVGQSNVPETISATSVKSIKVASAVSISATAVRTEGPMPPRAGEPTQFEVNWQVRGGSSAIADGTVSTTLPGYVEFGASSGSGAVSYDSSSRKVTWKVGNLPQGGSSTASFTVVLTPSTSQSGTAPSLTGPSTFTGYDRFAGQNAVANAEAVTTETGDDDGVVQ